MDPNKKRKLIRLISTLLDCGSLDASQKHELNSILMEDEEARKLYYEVIAMEQNLDSTQCFQENKAVRGSRRLLQFSLLKIAASLVIGSFFTYLFFSNSHPDASSAMEQVATNQWVGVIQQQQGVLRYNGELFEKKDDLFVGKYALEEGSLGMEFYEGASIFATAPCEFEILSPTHINVLKGSLGAKVYDARSGFKISNRKAIYIDLGTKFSVNFDEAGNSDLHVFEGKVLASSLSPNGDSERVRLVKQEESFGIRNNNHFKNEEVFQKMNHRHTRYVPPVPEPIEFDSRYTEEVLKSNPEAYWKLDHSFHNSAEGNSGFTIQAIGEDVSFKTTDHISNSFIHLAQAKTFNALKIQELFHVGDNANFSIELWASPDKYNRVTLFGLYDPAGVEETGETNHIAIIDFMHKSRAFHHTPSAIRTAYRPTASDDYYFGINMFTRFHYVPGRWYHIVLVKASDYVATFINGVKTSHVPLGEEDYLEAGQYAAIFGQMSIQDWSTAEQIQKRPFTGGIDEIAIYRRALDAEEIANHYHSAMGR